MRLTPDQIETLRVLGNGLGRADEAAQVLELHGLCVTGRGRFGSWARITDAGRQYLDRMSGERSCRASPRQVLAAPAPKAAASNSPSRGSRAGGGSCSPAGSPCVDRHNVSTPLPRPASTPERRKPGASQDRATSSTRAATSGSGKGGAVARVEAGRRYAKPAPSQSSTRMRAQAYKVAPPTMSSARPLPSKSSGVASFGGAKAATGSRQGHVPAGRVSRKPATTTRAPTARALASATPTSTTHKSR